MATQNNQTVFIIKGMHCGSCVTAVEKAIAQVNGVQDVRVNFADGRAYVTGNATAEAITKAVAKAGYKAEAEAEASTDDAGGQQALWQFARSLPALALAVWLMLETHLGGAPRPPFESFWFTMNWIVLMLMGLAGWSIYKNFLRSVYRLKPDMYTLVGMGTLAAWVYSCLVLYLPAVIPPEARTLYYEAALFILAFINIGQSLEHYVKGRSSDAVRKLMALSPPKAIRLRNSQEETISLSDVEVDDLLKVRPGDTIPVDGMVEEGESSVSEAMITGESSAVTKSMGSEVIGGTLNQHGTLIIRAAKVGRATVLAKIVDMVRTAQSTKPAIARLVDKVAGVFSVVVLALAALTAGIWAVYGPEPQLLYAFTVAMTMLVIACPCALGLATPISVMAGVSRAARSGILFAKGDALQQLGLADVVIFDKTGTLTKGKPKVVDVVAGEGHKTERVLQIAASLGANSSHPLSEAIVKEAEHKEVSTLKTTRDSSQAGGGLGARIGGRICLLGSKDFVEGEKVKTDDFSATLDRFLEQGKTAVFITREGEVIGLIALRDEVRQEAREAVSQLKKQGRRVVMLTGDNKKAAEAVGAEIGIREVRAAQKPDDKQNYIKELQKQGQYVAMVGDGINDAPSMSQAHVGVSVATGSDIAKSAADVVIAVEDLLRIPLAAKVSRATSRNIKQNIFWAFVYNSVAIPVAAGVFYPLTGELLPPWVAGAAMAASSLTVVLNASRLNWIKGKL